MIELLMRTSELGSQLGVYQFDQQGLLTLLGSNQPHERLVALAHLTEEDFFDAGDAGFVAKIKSLATQGSQGSTFTRALAFEALGNSGSPAASEILAAGVTDPDFTVRESALEALVELTAATGQRGALQSIHAQRSKFEPTNYTDNDLNLRMREDIEQAMRKFEPTWASIERAQSELRENKSNATSLLAAAYLAPRDEGMAALLDALRSGSDGAKTYALMAIGENATATHLPKLRAILAAESDPERKMMLESIIDPLSK